MVVAGRFAVSSSMCVHVHTHTAACEYRDSSLKIQMEYRAFEERSARGLRGAVGSGSGGWKVAAGEVEEEDSAGTGDEGDISKIEY